MGAMGGVYKADPPDAAAPIKVVGVADRQLRGRRAKNLAPSTAEGGWWAQQDSNL